MTENQGSNHTILHTGFVRERAEPGMLLLRSDSHTCSAGAVSALAIGLGAADVMTALATGETWLRVPESVRVDFVGEPPWYIGGKDIILYILRRLKRNTAAADRVIEFGGSSAAALSCDARFAICNMCTELGAITGIKNRMGSGAIEHLCSAAVVAASSSSMTLTDPSDLLANVSHVAHTTHLTRVSAHKLQSSLAVKPLKLVEPNLHDCMKLLPPRAGDEHRAVVQGQHSIINSRVSRLGDFIIPAGACLGDPSDVTLGEHCLELSVPTFRESVRNGQQVVVAGHAFGCGSSREEAPRALKGLGVRCVVARSIAYIFARNMPNIDMLAICLDDDAFFAAAAHDEHIAIDTARLHVTVGGRSWSFTLNNIERQLLRVGGLTRALKEHGEQLFAATSSTASGWHQKREARSVDQQEQQEQQEQEREVFKMALVRSSCSPSSAPPLSARRICHDSIFASAMDDLFW